MDHLTIHETPDKKLEHLIIVFSGWADAAEGATSAVKFLQRKLSAKKFAEIDPEEFYDFTEVRPYTRLDENGERIVTSPSSGAPPELHTRHGPSVSNKRWASPCAYLKRRCSRPRFWSTTTRSP